MENSHLNPNTRHDFLYFFSVEDGNPNGDPDAGNLPRTDPTTGQGLVTDVCVKRKLRNYVDAARDDKRIFMQMNEPLAAKQQEAYEALKLDSDDNNYDNAQKARHWMMQNFWDVRMFGAVMSSNKEVRAGKVQGPMQLTFARSLEPIDIIRTSITRSMPLNEDKQKGTNGNKEKGNTTFGQKSIVPSAVYRGRGFYSPADADEVSEDDLQLFWQALQMSWELDRSAARGMLSCEGIVVFTHESKLGNARAAQLFDLVRYDADGVAVGDVPDKITTTVL